MDGIPFSNGAPLKRKNPAAVALGKRSAQGRLAKISAKKRSEIARHAALTRWARSPKTRKETP